MTTEKHIDYLKLHLAALLKDLDSHLESTEQRALHFEQLEAKARQLEQRFYALKHYRTSTRWPKGIEKHQGYLEMLSLYQEAVEQLRLLDGLLSEQGRGQ